MTKTADHPKLWNTVETLKRVGPDFASFDDLLVAYNAAAPELLKLSRRSLFRRIAALKRLGVVRYSATGYQRKALNLSFVPRQEKNSNTCLKVCFKAPEDQATLQVAGPSAREEIHQGKQEADSKELSAPLGPATWTENDELAALKAMGFVIKQAWRPSGEWGWVANYSRPPLFGNAADCFKALRIQQRRARAERRCARAIREFSTAAVRSDKALYRGYMTMIEAHGYRTHRTYAVWDDEKGRRIERHPVLNSYDWRLLRALRDEAAEDGARGVALMLCGLADAMSQGTKYPLAGLMMPEEPNPYMKEVA